MKLKGIGIPVKAMSSLKIPKVKSNIYIAVVIIIIAVGLLIYFFNKKQKDYE